MHWPPNHHFHILPRDLVDELDVESTNRAKARGGCVDLLEGAASDELHMDTEG